MRTTYLIRIIGVCCLILPLLLSGCSEKITPPQETVFDFLDQVLRGDPQLLADSYNMVDHSRDPQGAAKFKKSLDARAKTLTPFNEGYVQRIFLIAENQSKPQTADISNQYLRIPDLYYTQEIELKRVNGSWKLTEGSATLLLQNLFSPTFIQTSTPTPDAGKWHEAKIYVTKRLIDHWDKTLKELQ